MALKNEKIYEHWEALIADGKGQAESIFNTVERLLEKAEPPEVNFRQQRIRAGGWLSGKTYDFLLVRNRHLKDFRIYLTAYDYGTSLHVAWFLTVEPGFFKRIVSMILFFWAYHIADPEALSHNLDVPKQLELSAYSITVHTAAKSAVRALMEQLEQDFSKVDTKSKGVLGLW